MEKIEIHKLFECSIRIGMAQMPNDALKPSENGNVTGIQRSPALIYVENTNQKKKGFFQHNVEKSPSFVFYFAAA